VRHNLVEALRGNPLAVFVVPGAVQEVEKARAQLAGPLKEIKEVEDSAKIMLEQYKKEQGQAETVLIKKALEELTSHIIDELYRETVKAENKRARKKAAERRKKEEARKAKSMATSVETTTEQSSAETLPLGPSTAQLQLGSAEGEPFDQHISGQKIQPATDLPLASEPSSESEQEEEETFKYQPFVKQSSPQGASSSDEASPTTAPAASMTRLTLKPRIHQLWETFWAPGIRWMEWKDFMQLFMHQNLGFGIQPVGGSVRNILYPSSLLPSRTGRDHFIVHEPHGRTTLGPSTIRSIQTKLAEDFGWSSETFQAE
jgi:hypothetical protein